MVSFPTIWELLLPNLNTFTIIMGLIILLGFVLIWFFGAFLKKWGWKKNVKGFMGIALILMILFSAFEDTIKSSAGQLWLWILIVLGVAGILIFVDFKKLFKVKK